MKNGAGGEESEKRLYTRSITSARAVKDPRELRRLPASSAGIPTGKSSLLVSPAAFLPAFPRPSTCLFILSPKPLHPRAIYGPSERHAPARPTPSPPFILYDRARRRFTYLMEFLGRGDSILIRRGLGILTMPRWYRRNHNLGGGGGKLVNFVRDSCEARR